MHHAPCTIYPSTHSSTTGALWSGGGSANHTRPDDSGVVGGGGYSDEGTAK
jgi:hypothetical protein